MNDSNLQYGATHGNQHVVAASTANYYVLCVAKLSTLCLEKLQHARLVVRFAVVRSG